jgi:hypothetical protein
MGWLGDLFKPKARSAASARDVAAEIKLEWEQNRKGRPARDYVSVKVTGEAHYQPALRAICGRRGDEAVSVEGKTALLVPEPDNPHDHLAVRVEIDGETVGYMSRGNAKRYHRRIQRLIDAGEQATVPAWIGCHGPGAENPNLGVRLKIPRESELEQPLR